MRKIGEEDRLRQVDPRAEVLEPALDVRLEPEVLLQRDVPGFVVDKGYRPLESVLRPAVVPDRLLLLFEKIENLSLPSFRPASLPLRIILAQKQWSVNTIVWSVPP